MTRAVEESQDFLYLPTRYVHRVQEERMDESGNRGEISECGVCSGTRAAADLVRDFLGRQYSFQAYADWLNAK